MPSQAELEIRKRVVIRLRELFPHARIVHELNINNGGNRADVVAVGPEDMFAVEIKSEKDTLDRLPKQLVAYSEVFRGFAIATHISHLQELKGPGMVHCSVPLWKYPGDPSKWEAYIFEPSHPKGSALLLSLLWRAELLEECERWELPFSKRSNMIGLQSLLAWELTGRNVYKSVCRQLRKRKFAEADPPIF